MRTHALPLTLSAAAARLSQCRRDGASGDSDGELRALCHFFGLPPSLALMAQDHALLELVSLWLAALARDTHRASPKTQAIAKPAQVRQPCASLLHHHKLHCFSLHTRWRMTLRGIPARAHVHRPPWHDAMVPCVFAAPRCAAHLSAGRRRRRWRRL
jgi:hypothetical protein